MDPENGSENAPNYEDVEEITVIDDSTVSFRLFRAERGFPGIHDDGHPAEAPAVGCENMQESIFTCSRNRGVEPARRQTGELTKRQSIVPW